MTSPSGCRNVVSHLQQFLSELPSRGRSLKTNSRRTTDIPRFKPFTKVMLNLTVVLKDFLQAKFQLEHLTLLNFQLSFWFCSCPSSSQTEERFNYNLAHADAKFPYQSAKLIQGDVTLSNRLQEISTHMFISFLLACPLSLGLGDGRIKDEQLSASSRLDDNHAAKQGRASLINSNYDRYRHYVD